MQDSSYRLTFPAGFRPLVERLVQRDFGPDSVIRGDESSLIVRSAHEYRDPGYVQAAALVVSSVSCGTLEKAYLAIAARLQDRNESRELLRVFRDKAFMRTTRAERFAVRGFLGNTPTFPGAEARRSLENVISRCTGARADSSRPDVELAVSLRSDGNAYLTAGFKGRGEEPLAAGSLPRQTARLLCEMAHPSPDDIFLDPFMGSGSIPLERALMGRYKLIFAGDRAEKALSIVKEKLKDKRFEKRKKTIFPKLLDAGDLSRFEDGLFTAIVTDPPWGDWEGLNEEELELLYRSFLGEAHRAMAPEGRLVLLTGRNGTMERCIASMKNSLMVEEAYDVLISGKKANAAVLRKAR